MKAKLLIPICLILFSCQKRVNDPVQPVPEPSQSTPLYERLVQLGFSTKDIVDLGKYYLVTGDLLFDKKDTDMEFFEKYFKQMKNPEKQPSTERHWLLPDKVANYNIENMKIETEEGVSNGEISEWRHSAATAMAHWAGISNCNINFVRYFNSWSGPRYINIREDGGALPPTTIAAARFPMNGSPAFEILVNLDYNNNTTISEGQRVYNLVHELGHCIGFHHTNWQIQQEPQYGATPVPGTSAGQDPNSVMNGGTADYTWSGFSSDDVIAARAIFPPGPYTKWITSPGAAKYPSFSHYFILEPQDPIQITWNASLVSTPTVTLQAYQNGVLKQTIASGIPNTGSFNYPIWQAVGSSGSHSVFEVQVRIVSDANPNIFDFSCMFDIYVD